MEFMSFCPDTKSLSEKGVTQILSDPFPDMMLTSALLQLYASTVLA